VVDLHGPQTGNALKKTLHREGRGVAAPDPSSRANYQLGEKKAGANGNSLEPKTPQGSLRGKEGQNGLTRIEATWGSGKGKSARKYPTRKQTSKRGDPIHGCIHVENKNGSKQSWMGGREQEKNRIPKGNIGENTIVRTKRN